MKEFPYIMQNDVQLAPGKEEGKVKAEYSANRGADHDCPRFHWFQIGGEADSFPLEMKNIPCAVSLALIVVTCRWDVSRGGACHNFEFCDVTESQRPVRQK